MGVFGILRRVGLSPLTSAIALLFGSRIRQILFIGIFALLPRFSEFAHLFQTGDPTPLLLSIGLDLAAFDHVWYVSIIQLHNLHVAGHLVSIEALFIALRMIQSLMVVLWALWTFHYFSSNGFNVPPVYVLLVAILIFGSASFGARAYIGADLVPMSEMTHLATNADQIIGSAEPYPLPEYDYVWYEASYGNYSVSTAPDDAMAASTVNGTVNGTAPNATTQPQQTELRAFRAHRSLWSYLPW